MYPVTERSAGQDRDSHLLVLRIGFVEAPFPPPGFQNVESTGRPSSLCRFQVSRLAALLQGLIVGSRGQQQDFVRAIEATGLQPVIDRSYGLDALAEAFRDEESGAHFGKSASNSSPCRVWRGVADDAATVHASTPAAA
jgi:hypothetical protein